LAGQEENFENYRDVSLKTYVLDPANFVTAPSFTYTNWFKYSSIEVELLVSSAMYQYFSEAKRGGITNVGEINFGNVYKRSGGPQGKMSPNRVIKGLDMNAQYPKAMCFLPPYKDFSFMSSEEATQALNTWNPLTDEWGCYLTVDIECPPEIHD
jgi:hypothetical protein